MPSTRRTLLGSGASAVVAGTANLKDLLSGRALRIQSTANARPTVRIGILDDQNGPYRDTTGPLGVSCVRQAIADFMPSAGDFTVELLVADHQNKADVAAAIARQWIDRDGVDMIVGLSNSSCALAVSSICREKDKVLLVTSAATGELTGRQCTRNTIHWVYDTYMLAKSTGGSIVRAGAKSWFFINPDYVFGKQLRQDTSEIVTQNGGTVVGGISYPFPDTVDFSAFLLEALASKAQVLALCSGGDDTVNLIKQAREFGLMGKLKLAVMLLFVTNVYALGLEEARGLLMSSCFYWDLNDRTRAFTSRIRSRIDMPPNMQQAGDYSATLHYLKTVAAMGAIEAKRSGATTVARMKSIPTDDDCFGSGLIREDGRKIHPVYLFQVKEPTESTSSWDLLKVVTQTPADQAFGSPGRGGCSL